METQPVSDERATVDMGAKSLVKDVCVAKQTSTIIPDDKAATKPIPQSLSETSKTSIKIPESKTTTKTLLQTPSETKQTKMRNNGVSVAVKAVPQCHGEIKQTRSKSADLVPVPKTLDKTKTNTTEKKLASMSVPQTKPKNQINMAVKNNTQKTTPSKPVSQSLNKTKETTTKIHEGNRNLKLLVPNLVGIKQAKTNTPEGKIISKSIPKNLGETKQTSTPPISGIKMDFKLTQQTRTNVGSSKEQKTSSNNSNIKQSQDRGSKSGPSSIPRSSERPLDGNKDRADRARRSRSRSRDRFDRRRQGRSRSRERRKRDRSRSGSRERVYWRRRSRSRSRERNRAPDENRTRRRSYSPEHRSDRRFRRSKSRSRSPRKRPRSNSPVRRSPRRRSRSRSSSPSRKVAKTSFVSRNTSSSDIIGDDVPLKMPFAERPQSSISEMYDQHLAKRKKELGELDEMLARMKAFKAMQMRANVDSQNSQGQGRLGSQHLFSSDSEGFEAGGYESVPLEPIGRSSRLEDFGQFKNEDSGALPPSHPSPDRFGRSSPLMDRTRHSESDFPILSHNQPSNHSSASTSTGFSATHPSYHVGSLSSQQSTELERKQNSNNQMTHIFNILSTMPNVDVYNPVVEQTTHGTPNEQRSGHMIPLPRKSHRDEFGWEEKGYSTQEDFVPLERPMGDGSQVSQFDGMTTRMYRKEEFPEKSYVDREEEFLYSEGVIGDGIFKGYDKNLMPGGKHGKATNSHTNHNTEELSAEDDNAGRAFDNVQDVFRVVGMDMDSDEIKHLTDRTNCRLYGAKKEPKKNLKNPRYSPSSPTDLSDSEGYEAGSPQRPSNRQVLFRGYQNRPQICSSDNSKQENISNRINREGLTMTIKNVPESDEDDLQQSIANTTRSPTVPSDHLSFAQPHRDLATGYPHLEQPPYAEHLHHGSSSAPIPVVGCSERPPPSLTLGEPYTVATIPTHPSPSAIQHGDILGHQAFPPPLSGPPAYPPPPTVMQRPENLGRQAYQSPTVMQHTKTLSHQMYPPRPTSLTTHAYPPPIAMQHPDNTGFQTFPPQASLTAPERTAPMLYPVTGLPPPAIPKHLQYKPDGPPVALQYQPQTILLPPNNSDCMAYPPTTAIQPIERGPPVCGPMLYPTPPITLPVDVSESRMVPSSMLPSNPPSNLRMLQEVSEISTLSSGLRIQSTRQETSVRKNLKVIETKPLPVLLKTKPPQSLKNIELQKELESKTIPVVQPKSKLAQFNQRMKEKNKKIMEARLASGIKESPTGIIASSKAVKNVWICGHSLVDLAEKRANSLEAGKHLDLDPNSVRLWWKGQQGMTLDQLVAQLSQLKLNWPNPDALVIHLGGNDVYRTHLEVLLALIKTELISVRNLFPDCYIVWSDILPRRSWSAAAVEDVDKSVDKIRVLINCRAHAILSELGGTEVTHHNIGPEFYRPDGIHLSGRGIDAFNSNIGVVLKKWESSTC